MRKILLFFLALGALEADAANYYWVNGAGQWSDLNHWRLGSSGGPVPSIVPGPGDNVFFDANSGFTAGSTTVTLNANGFCNDMTWGAVTNSPTFVASNASFTVQVNGNAVLSPTTTYNIRFAFKGTTLATLTANGSVLGEFGMEIDKPGSSLTLTDDLVIPATTTAFGTGGSTLLSGTFDISGKNVTVLNFISDNGGTRTLQMTNANLTTTVYRYTGLNKTLNATGSTLHAAGIATDGGTYNKATATTGTGPNTNVINGTTFGSLTFTSATQTYSDIAFNNIIDTLVFYGTGTVSGNNTVGYILCGGQGSIGTNNTIGSIAFNGIGFVSSGNTIGKVTAQKNLQITGVNTIDSLLLAPNKTTTLAGTLNINKYLKAQGVSCDAFTEIIAADTAHIYFAPTATALIDNVNLTYIAAHGNITPITVSGVDGDGNAGFNITPPASLSGTNLYWVGGAGDWNDNTHWSYTSGGPGGACIPFIADTVIFNSASGLGSSQIVTTSGNAYCYNMKWLPGVGTTSFNEPSASAFYIYGSLVLTPGVFMNSVLEFVGTDSTSTVTTNGATSGSLFLYIRKKGAGKVTLADNWTNANGVIQQVAGRLDMANRTLSINRYTGNSNGIRALDISNANITVGNSWAYIGANKSINSTGSSVTSLYSINVDGLTYPKIDITYNGAGNSQAFSVSGTTIGTLTFAGTNAVSEVNIDSNNTIRRLEFKGAGAIAGGGNVIDTLLLAGSRNYQVTGTSTINNYLLAQSAACTGLLEIRGNTTGGFQFGPSAVIDVANVYLQNMSATGVPPVAVSGADAGGNSGWVISSAAGTPHYWVGGSGDWNDNAHWSTTSGGAGGACIPTVYDDVYFNAGSGFTAGSKTVTVNNGNAYCRNLDWTGAANSPVWNKANAWTIEVWGDTTVLNASATFTVSPLTFKGSTNAVMSGSALGNFDIRVQKPGGSLKLLSDYSNILTDILVNDGTLDLSGRTLSIASISNEGLANTMGMNISNANITLDTLWRYNGAAAAHTLVSTGSTITAETFLATGMTYNKVNVSGILNTNAVFSNATIGQLTFTNASTASQIGINGTNNTIDTLEYKGSGGVYGTGNTINTLMFFPGKIYTFTAGTTTNVTGEWFASGTPCNLTEIVSSSTTTNATINKTGGAPEFDYIRLRRITAAGSTPFVAFEHTINQGNNTNWSIAPYNGASPIYGLGPDTLIAATAFPYVLHTDGFFGSPSSQYTWNDNSTADSLVITGPGTYSVDVSFVDGCNLSDQITIALFNPLPVDLISFSANEQGCSAHLNWKVANAADFSHFVVERSTDGRNFTAIANVPYTNVAGYAYTDLTPHEGLNHYRLKLVNINTRYSYSNTVSANIACSPDAVKVYPTVTKGTVLVNLPAGYEKAQIKVFTSLGQVVTLPNSPHVGLNNLSFNGLAQGQYLLKISNGADVQTFKVFYQP